MANPQTYPPRGRLWNGDVPTGRRLDRYVPITPVRARDLGVLLDAVTRYGPIPRTLEQRIEAQPERDAQGRAVGDNWVRALTVYDDHEREVERFLVGYLGSWRRVVSRWVRPRQQNGRRTG